MSIFSLMMTAEGLKRETLGDFVRQKTVDLGGFKDWEMSSIGRTEDGNLADIYSGFVPSVGDKRRGLHIVIGRKIEKNESVWYFATFRGPSWNDMTAEEYEKYTQRESDLLKNKYKVRGGRLESLIREAVSSLP